MKRVLAIALWLLSVSLSAQVVTSAEFFWGTTDPGVGNGTAMTASDGSFDEAVEQVIKAGISLPSTNGIHLFNIRVKDEDGNWGPLFKKAISVENSLTLRDIKVTGAEFFWGTSDPGAGSGTALLAFDNAYDEALETVFKSGISLPSTNGIHLFNIRVKDEDGNWGPLFKKAVSIENSLALRDIKVTGAEFFWGTSDPGAGSGTALLAFDNAYDEALETVFKSGITLPSTNGIHLFNIRVKDEDGNWGPLYKKAVSIENSLTLRDIKVTGAEFFWGTSDPGAGSGTALLAFDNAYDEALETVFKSGISLPSTNGIHLFNIRVKDEDGNWGPLYKKAVSIENSLTLRDIKVTGAEFFWGTSDPGAGSGTALLAFDNAYDEALETVFKSGISLPSTNGIHLFNIRVKDEDGNWGPLYKKAVSIENSLALRDLKLTAVEYFWGTNDPGAGSGTAVLAFDNAYDEALETAFKAGVYPPLSGWNLFNIRAADEDGNWGPIYKKAVWADEGTNPIQIAFPTVLAINCHGGSDGEITATVSGGTAPYSLSWSNGDTVLTTDNLIAGKYVLTVTDATGLTNKDSVTLVDPTQMVVTTVSTTDVTCAGNDGAATISVTGGTSPYTYSWIGSSSTTASANNLAAGQYTVTVTDANGCSELYTVTVSLDPASLSVTSTSLDPSCFGGNDGSASLAVTGGQAPYTYSWSNGATSNSVTGLSAGTYTVTITDVNSCQSSATITLNNPTQIVAPMVSLTNPNCTGSNGIAQITNIISGASYYWFSVISGVSTAAGTGTSLSGLSAGDYEVYGVTAAGCTTRTSSFVLVGSNAPVSLALVAQTNVSCSGNSNGFLNVAASGGTAPYTYSWSNGGTGSAIINLSAGSYTVTVTDANGCAGNSTYTITQPSNPLTINLISAFDVNCFGASTGSITVNASGGQGVYSYAWSNGQTGQQLTNLAAGSYTVTVTDGSGCSAQLTQSVTQPVSGLTATVRTKDDASCGGQNGAVAVNITGGTAPYVYSWSTGSNTDSIGGLGAGTYSLTVLDASGCSSTFSYTIQSTSSNLAVNASHTDVSCYGGTNGTGSLSVSGGTAPYTYSWSSSVTGFTSVNASSVTSLQAGTYTVLVTDAGGCTGTASFTVSEPSSALAVSGTQVVDVTCFGGNNGGITVAASGGTAPYIYSWNTGQSGSQLTNLIAGSYTVTVTDGSGCSAQLTQVITQPVSGLTATVRTKDDATCGGQNGSVAVDITGGTSPYIYSWSTGGNTDSIGGLGAGTYSLTVLDASGCSSTFSYTIQSTSSNLAVNASHTDVSCYGVTNGTGSLSVSGGTAPYTYSWSSSVTGFTSVNASSVTSLQAGTYTVLVTDAGGCTGTASFTVSEPSSALAVSGTQVVDVTCFGGNNGGITVAASGGTAPYIYSWNTGQSGSQLTNLIAGSYTVTVTDANGCTESQTFMVDEPLSAPTVTLITVNVACFGGTDGSITASVSGGTSPYTYSWNTGASSTSISNLSQGSYTLIVSDANGCNASAQASVSAPAQQLTLSSGTSTDVLCYGDSTGALDVTASGGTVPYSYVWTGPNGFSGSTASIANLTAGAYSVTVTDANNCVQSLTLSVLEPNSPISAALSTVSDIVCFGGQGIITLNPTGGAAPYSFSWNSSPTNTTSSLTSNVAGYQLFTITDANGCTLIDSLAIQDNSSPISIDLAIKDVDCFGGNNGTMAALPIGGTAPYSFIWSTTSTQDSIYNLSPGSYWVSVLDANGCSKTDTGTVGQPSNPITVVSTTTDVACYGDSTGSASLTVQYFNSTYDIQWNTGDTTSSLTGLAAGTYSYFVQDSLGCSVSDSVLVDQSSSPLSALVSGTDPDCIDGSNGSIAATAAGGTPNYSYLWSTGDTISTISALDTGIYTLTVTDHLGCSVSDSVVLDVQNPMAVSILNQTPQLDCDADSTGVLTTLPSGGHGNYQFTWSNGQITSSATGLPQGVYWVSVQDAKGCISSDTTNISAPPPVAMSLGMDTTLSGYGLLCYGDTLGQAYATALGGNGGYSFVWSNGVMSDSVSGLIAGTYSVTITDSKGCSSSDSLTITSPASIQVNTGIITNSYSFTNDCWNSTDGTAFVQLPLGLSATWSNFMAGDTVANLAPGKQWVTLTDTLGCQSTDTLTMTAPASLSTTMSVISNYNGYQISCYGLSDGEASVSVSGGVGGYTWNWSNGGTTPINQNLSSGVTTVTISDALGCTTLDSISITEPNALSTSTSVSDLSCYTSEDGAAYVNITGGVTPYNVNWSGIGQSGLSATALTAGYYGYIITDGNGCSLSDSASVDAPDEIVLSIDTVSPSCYESTDGELTFYATGGSGGFNYYLNNASSLGVVDQIGPQTFLLQATDANNCSVYSTISLVPQRDECLVIPNYFSPNADGYNDTWEILGMDLSDYEVIVFNVAGQEIYRTSSANYEPWDGKYDSKVLPDGDYYFIIQDQTTNTAGYVTLRK